MESTEIGADGPKPSSGPGAGAGGAAVILVVLTTVIYVGTGSFVSAGLVFVALALGLVAFNAFYDRYVL